LSFERSMTSSVVAGEYELVVDLLAYVARDHRIATEHVFDGGDGFLAVSLARAGIADCGWSRGSSCASSRTSSS
jgi:hypothetical protein